MSELLRNEPAQWARVEAHLDRLLDLPAAERAAMLSDIAKIDSEMSRELAELLTYADMRETPLDKPAFGSFDADKPYPVIETGRKIGAYRIVAPLGQGGMGEVYLAERCDGQFEQQVALKLIRPDAIDNMARFQFERQTLARLDHPNITRVYDGGILEDGRPYMVMEFITGQAITAWCRDNASPLDKRLDLFITVCRAVAHAHRNLVVHRDIKPGNVLVTADGTVKVIDFGIAKQIVDGAYPETRAAPVTPAYAAPEQLTGGVISTATDVYALGMLLYELLAGRRPLPLDDVPLVHAVDMIVNQLPPPLSKLVSGLPAPPVPAKALAGDLDAIVAQALRKEPERRYQTVESLIADIDHFRRQLPVSARGGTRGYVLGRFIRRHLIPIAAAAITLVAIIGGLGGVTAQYFRAEREAKRATVIKTFLQELFNDRDPNFPTDKPRDQVTANDLIRVGVSRIDRNVSEDPELRIELLGAIAEIYGNLSEYDKAIPIKKKQLEEIYKYQGPLSSKYLTEMAHLAGIQNTLYDFDSSQETLASMDPLIRQGDLDKSAIRAQWWSLKGQILKDHENKIDESEAALAKSIDLFAKFAPHDDAYAVALDEAASIRFMRGDYRDALQLNRRALAVMKDPEVIEPSLDNRVEVEIMIANSLRMLGDIPGADQAYQEAAKLALEFGGTANRDYWTATDIRALVNHLHGDRDKAMALFADLLPKVPADPSANIAAGDVYQYYARCLASEGRANLAVPILESVVAGLRAKGDMNSQRYVSELFLGDAYDRVGRIEEARATLRDDDAYIQAHMPGSIVAAVSGERWARFLLDHGDPGAAKPLFDAVIAVQDRWQELTPAPALAWSGRARIALAAGDIGQAVEAGNTALAVYGKVRASHDVRFHAYLLLIHSRVMLAAGKTAQAIEDARTALSESRRTDAPESPAIKYAETALAEAQRAQTR